MSRHHADKPATRDSAGKAENGNAPETVTAGQWEDEDRPVRRTFNGPPGAAALLRVAMERTAYAALLAHAKESVDREVCGVLAGLLCEDDKGLFLSVEAVIPGAKAREGNTHVTFTQETWNHIHETLKREHPGRRIVGWYHTHPGYGIAFSEMDAFVHKHFFPGPAQAALVLDPLGGETALAVNAADGVAYVDRFWVDGREHRLKIPEGAAGGPAAADGSGGGNARLEKRLDELDVRVSQVIQALDAQSAAIARTLTILALLVGLTVVFLIGYSIYRHMTDRITPPELQSFIPVPVQIGDKAVLLGIGVAQWEIPPDLQAVQVAIEKEKAAAREAAAAALDAAGTTPPPEKQGNWFTRLFRKDAEAAPAAPPAPAPKPSSNGPPEGHQP